MTVTKDSTTALDSLELGRRSAINGSDLLELAQRENANWEKLYDAAAPGAGGLTETAQSHDANGNGCGIRRGVSGSFYIPAGGLIQVVYGSQSMYTYSMAYDSSSQYPAYSGANEFEIGWIQVSPGIEKIVVVLCIKASTAELGPQVRVVNRTDGTASDDDEAEGAWTDITAAADWYNITVPVTDDAPNLATKKFDIEVRAKTPKDTSTTYTLYFAMPAEHQDEPVDAE